MKLRLPKLLKIALLACFSTLCIISTIGTAQSATGSVSINFGNGEHNGTTTSGPGVILSDENTAGAILVAGTGWNNFLPKDGTNLSLKDALAQNTAMLITYTSANTYMAGGNPSTQNGRLTKGYLDDGGGIAVTVSNVNYFTYDVYIICSSDVLLGNDSWRVNGADYRGEGGKTVLGNSTWGTTTSNITDILAEGTNYLKIAMSSGGIQLNANTDNSGRAGLAGLQIANTYEGTVHTYSLDAGTDGVTTTWAAKFGSDLSSENHAGIITVTGTGTYTVSMDANVLNDGLRLNAGHFAITSGNLTAHRITVDTGAIFDFSGSLSLALLNGGGTFNMLSGTLSLTNNLLIPTEVGTGTLTLATAATLSLGENISGSLGVVSGAGKTVLNTGSHLTLTAAGASTLNVDVQGNATLASAGRGDNDKDFHKQANLSLITGFAERTLTFSGGASGASFEIISCNDSLLNLTLGDKTSLFFAGALKTMGVVTVNATTSGRFSLSFWESNGISLAGLKGGAGTALYHNADNSVIPTITINTKKDQTYAWNGNFQAHGRVSKNISIVKDGEGTQILTGLWTTGSGNAFSTTETSDKNGDYVTVKGGTLQVGGTKEGAATAAGRLMVNQLNIAVESDQTATLAFNTTTNQSYASTVVGLAGGTIALLASNTSAISFTGDVSAYQGKYIVRGGTLSFAAANAFHANNSFEIYTGGILDLSNRTGAFAPASLTFGGGTLRLGGLTGQTVTTQSLTVNAGAHLDFRFFGASNNDQFVANTLTLDAGAKFNFNLLGSNFAEGMKFTVLTATSGFTFEENYAYTITGSGSLVIEWRQEGNSLIGTLAVNKSSVLTWNLGGSGEWNTTAQSWVNGNGADAMYSDGKDVIFNDVGLGSGSAATITLMGNFTPGAVRVENAEGTTYTFAGEGLISGSSILTKLGDGTLIIDTANTYTGGTLINGGLVQVTEKGRLGSGSVTFQNDAILEMYGHTPGHSVFGSGTLVLKAGSTAAGSNYFLGGDNHLSTATIQFQFDGGGRTFDNMVPFVNENSALGGLFILDLKNVIITGNLSPSVKNGMTLNLGEGAIVSNLQYPAAVGNGAFKVTGGTITVNVGVGSVLGRGVGGISGDQGGFAFTAQDGQHIGDIYFNVQGGTMEAEMMRFGTFGFPGVIGNVYMHLSSGSLESSVRAAASWGGQINGSLALQLSGGSLGKTGTTRDFNPTGYGNSASGTPVTGNVSITLTGDDSSGYGTTFLGTYNLYGGSTNGSIGGNSTITLQNITKKHTDGTTGFANNTTSTISGGNASGGGVAGSRSLVFDHYTTEAAAKFIHFQTATVKGSSDLILLNNGNTGIGAWSVLGSKLTAGVQNALGGGAVTLDASSTLQFGTGTATAGIAFKSGALTTVSGSTLNFHVFDTSYDSLTSTGAINLDAGTKFNIVLSGSDLSGREITLMTGTVAIALAQYVCTISGVDGFGYEWVTRGNSLFLRLLGTVASQDFIWKGQDNATWSSASWDAMLASRTLLVWETGKNAMFTDEMGANRTITLDTTITAGNLLVDTQYNVVFAGAESLNATAFTKNGTGNLTVDVALTVGSTVLTGSGQVILNGLSSLGATSLSGGSQLTLNAESTLGAITLNGGSLIFNAVTTTGTLTSSGTNTIGGTGSMSGNITLSNGTLKFGGDVMVAGSTITVSGASTISSDSGTNRVIHSTLSVNNLAATIGDSTNTGHLSFDKLSTAGGNGNGSTLNVKVNTNFLETAFGGWGATLNVDVNVLLNLGNLSQVGINEVITKQGAGTVRITDHSATVYKRWNIVAGAVEFDLAGGKNLTYGSTTTVESGWYSAFVGAGKLIKSGDGILQMTGIYANTFTGGLELRGGTLLVSNSNLLGGSTADGVTTNRNIIVNGDVTLGLTTGTSLVFNTLNLTSGSLNVGGTSITNSFTISSLVGGSSSLKMDVIRSADGVLSSDAFIFAGAFTASNSINLILNVQGTMLNDEFTLFSWTGANASALSFFTYNAPTDTRITGELKLNSSNTGIIFKVTGELAHLVWAGGDGTWNVKGANKWTGALDGLFWNEDHVTFGTADAGSTGTTNTVTLEGDLKPSSLVVTGMESYTFSGTGSIIGKTSLVKDGTGTLTINTNNSYTGGTMLNAGTIVLGHANALGTTGTITFAGGALTYGEGITTDISSRVAFAAGASLKINTGSNAITWATALGNLAIEKDGTGKFSFTHAEGTYSGALTLTAGTLEMNSTNNTLLTSTIIGAGTLIYTGGNTLTLNATTNLVGFTGTLELATGSSIMVDAALDAAETHLKLGQNVILSLSNAGNFNANFKSITLSSGSKIHLNFGGYGGTVGGEMILDTGVGFAEISALYGSNGVLTGKITGTGNIRRSSSVGNNAMNFRDGWLANDYIGLTEFVSPGGTNYVLSNNVSVTNDATITPFGQLNDGVFNSGMAQLLSESVLTINGRSTTATNVTLANGFIYGNTGSSVNLVDLGVSLQITGAITVNAEKSGSLNYNTNNTATVTLAGGLAGSGELSLGNSTAGTTTFIVGDKMSFTGGLTLGANIIFNVNNANALTLSAVLKGTGKFEKSGAGILTVSRDQLVATEAEGVYSSAHTFTGGTIVSAGTLALGGVTADGAAGGTFQFGTGALSLETDATVSLSLSGGEGNNYTFTNAWDIQGNSSIVFAFGGTANHLSGAMSLADNTTLTLSMLHGSTDATGGMFLDGALSGSASSKIIVENSLQTEWSQARNLHLTVVNDAFLGTIQITNVDADHAHSLALYLDHAQAATHATIELDGLAEDKTADLVVNVASATIGNVTGDGFSRLQGAGTNSLTITNASGIYAGTSSGALSLDKQGSGKWILTGANAATGSLTISAGNLEFGGTAGTWAGAVVNNASLIFNHTASFSFTQAISGTGSLTKQGDQELTISGNNSYTGETILNGGTLILGSATGFANSQITINSGTLNLGTHAISNAIRVMAGGTATLFATAYTGSVDVQGSLTLGSATAGTLSLNGATEAAGILNLAGYAASSIVVKGYGTISNHAGYTGMVDVQAGGSLSATGMNLKISGNASLRAFGGSAGISHTSLQIENGVTLTLASTYVLNDGQSISFGDQSHLAGSHVTMSGNLTLNGGSLLFTLNGGEKQVDQLLVNGTLAVTGVTTLKVTRAGSFSEGDSYLLITAGNVLSDDELNLLRLDIQKGRSVVDLQRGATNQTEIYLHVGATDKLIWRGEASGDWSTTGGTAGGGSYDSGLPWNVQSTPGYGDNHFYTFDDVIFTNDTDSLKTVNIKDSVNAASILVNGTGDFEFVNAGGSITGSAAFLKQGTGTLTMSGANSSFAGSFTLDGGVVVLNDSLALGSTGMIHYQQGSFTFGSNFDLSSRLNMRSTVLDMTVEDTFTVATGDKLSNIALTKAGTGTLTMNLVADQTRAITLIAGKLEMTLSNIERSISGGISGNGTLILKNGIVRMSGAVDTNVLLDSATLTWVSGSTGDQSITMQNSSSLITGIATSNRSLILKGANSLGSSFAGAVLTGDITTESGVDLNILGMSGAYSLSLTGNINVSGALNLADTARLTLGAASGKTQSFSTITVGNQGVLTVKGNVNFGGDISGTGALSLSGGTVTATAAWSNALATSILANTTLDTGAYDIVFNGAVTGSDTSTLSKMGTGKLTLNAISTGKIDLIAGALDFAGQASTISLTVSGKGTSLSGANALTGDSSIDINGGLSTSGDVAGTLNLNNGAQLNINSGNILGKMNVSGATTLNKAAAASWTSMELAANTVLDYQVGGVTSSLVLGATQSLTVNTGAQFKGGLTLDGGTFILGMSQANDGDTVMTLQNGSLNVLSATSIDISSANLSHRGEYIFTLIAGAGNLVDLNLLSLSGFETLNLQSAPVLTIKDGSLMLSLTASASLFWAGKDGGNTWSYAPEDENWMSEGETTHFVERDFVVFDASAANCNVVLASGVMRPGSMMIDSTSAYTFSGAGSITVTGKLVQKGVGSLTFSNDGVNSFLKGVYLTAGSGTTVLAGKSSFVGDLTINADLEISSSAISQLSNVTGAGNILIDGTGGAHLSGTAGVYTGKVTVKQGVLNNQNVVSNKGLNVLASGNVALSGITNAHINSLKTTQAGVTISGLSGSITTMDNSFVLSSSTSNQEVIHFGATGGSLDMGTLNLVFDDIVLLDPTGQHTFKITDGVFGAELNKHDDFGKYTNFVVTGTIGDNDDYYVLGIQGGSVTIGGLTAYENFVLDVNNKWTPHITQKQAAKFTAAEFRANANDLFKSVTVDGVLQLIGTDAFILNSLSGASSGWIGLTDAVAVTIRGTDTVYKGTFAAGSADVTFEGIQSMMGRMATRTLSLADNAHLTVGGLTSVTGDLTLGADSELTINFGAQVSVGGHVNLGMGAKLSGEGTLTIAQSGSLTLSQGASLESGLILNILPSGGSEDTGFVDIGGNEIFIGGLEGAGMFIAEKTGVINLNLGTDITLRFDGTLSGLGGMINKLGEGTQILAAKTATGSAYSLNVLEGNLVIEAANGRDSAEYGAITVGEQGIMHNRAARVTSVLSTSPKPSLLVHTNVTAQRLTVQRDGLLIIGSDSNFSSLTITETADFQTGSSLEMYIGGNEDKALIKVLGNIKGLDDIGTLTLHAAISWQAYVKAVLFASDQEIEGGLNVSKVTMDGFGNQTITKTDDEKSIVFEASRSMDNNPFRDQVTGQNALAGLDLIWAANIEAGAKKTNLDVWSELGSVFNSITMTGAGSPEAHRLLAGVAGSTVTALAGSQRDDFRQQQTWIRNRTVGMGISPDFVHEDLPYVNGWIQANTGTKRVDSNGDEAGYNLDTFGGTVGFDVDMSAKITWGFAFTANYNKLTASGAESAKGRNDAYYANLFLRAQSKRWGHTVILTGGWNDAKLDRTVSGVGVNYTANGTTKGSTLGAMYEATYDYVLNENKTSILQPLFNLSFANASMDAYKEEGAGNAGLDVGSTDATYGTASLGARLMGTVGESFLGRSAIGELRLQVAQDFGDETNVARVGLGGIQRDVIGSKVGKTSVQIGAGITIPVTEQGALYLDVNTDFRSKATDVNGSVGYRVNF